MTWAELASMPWAASAFTARRASVQCRIGPQWSAPSHPPLL
jgi:hypothetical protein